MRKHRVRQAWEVSGTMERQKNMRPRYARLAAVLSVVAAMLLLMRNAQSAAEAVRCGLTLCARTMIPTLFPFMVLSELIVRTGAGRAIARALGWLLRPLFGVSESGACALAMGALCGFPVGARTAAAYYRCGHMSVRELNHVLCFCNVPSAAYLIGAVGISLFDSAMLGRVLLYLVLGGAAVIGLLWRWLLPHRVQLADAMPMPLDETKRSGVSLLPTAISAAAGSMLGVCATVLLFGVMVELLGNIAAALGAGDAVRVALCGLLELSAGVSEAATLTDVRMAAILCAAAAGWGGLSVHCQIMAVCDGCPLALGWFWASRALSALLAGGGMWLCLESGLLCLKPHTLRPIAAGGAWQTGGIEDILRTTCMLLFAVALGMRAILLLRKKRKGGSMNGA